VSGDRRVAVATAVVEATADAVSPAPPMAGPLCQGGGKDEVHTALPSSLSGWATSRHNRGGGWQVGRCRFIMLMWVHALSGRNLWETETISRHTES
jgi:hypothetical protein